MPEIHVARFEWVDDEWRAPGGDNIGFLDLRNRAQRTQRNGLGGAGIFVYPSSRIGIGINLGSSLTLRIRAAQRRDIEDLLAIPRGSIRAGTVLEMIRQILLELGEPINRWFPIRGSLIKGVKVWLGGFGQIIDDVFTREHPAFRNSINVYHSHYRELRQLVDGGLIQIEALRKQTRVQMLVRGFTEEEALPHEFRQDGSQAPSTMFEDAMEDTNGTNLEDHLLDTGQNWVLIQSAVGDIEIQSNEARTTVATVARYRVSENLSTDGHRAKANVETSGGAGNSRRVGYIMRLAVASDSDYYRAEANVRSNDIELRRFEADVPTVVQDVNKNFNDGTPRDFRVEVDENGNWKFFVDDIEEVAARVTDDGLVGNLRIGLFGNNNSGGGEYAAWDDVLLEDETPPPPPPVEPGLPEYGQGRAAIGDPPVYGATIVRS